MDQKTALDVVRADPSPVERRRRRRRIIQSIVITFVLSFGWIGAMVVLQTLARPGYNYRAETQEVLERIRDNKAETVYREASPLLQESIIMDSFLELASDMRATLGGFREISAIKRVDSTSGPGGETGRARASLIFDRGKISSDFSYHRVDDRWRLLGFTIDIPDQLKGEAASRSETKAVRVEAPAEVHALLRRVLERVSDGESATIYDEAAPTFRQSIARESFLDLQKQREAALGHYIGILDTLESWRSQGRTQSQVSVLAQFDKARTTVTLGFIRIDDQWKLAHYKVVMPRPRIPRPSSPAP